MLKTKKRLDELEARIDLIDRSLNNLRDYVYDDGFKSEIALALQEVLDTHQGMSIRHYVNNKEITTKLIKDELEELNQQQAELEWALKQIKNIRQKYGK